MFSFSLVSPSDGNYGFRASLFSFGQDLKILADPSWNGENSNDVIHMEKHLREVGAILLSHPTPEFLGGYVLLCSRFRSIMSTIPVYSTLPVSQLGRVSTVEFYRAKGILGPLMGSILEVEDVDEWFDKIIPLKYMQTFTLAENKIMITPFNAGHTLGGTFWSISKRLEKVIYAPLWNHSKDSFLNSASFLSAVSGNPLAQLMRPTALITNTDLGSSMSHKKRTEKFLQLVDATLANGGAVLLPTSLSGRFLELLHLIDKHLQSAPIAVYFLSYSGTKILNYASNLLEWMSSQLVKEWEEASSSANNSSNKNNFPFDPSKVDLLSDPSELLQLSGPKVVFCSGSDFKNGDMSSEALQCLCSDEKTTIILTEKTYFGDTDSINAQLYNFWYESLKKSQDREPEDGTPVPVEKTFSIDGWTREVPLIGSELSDFQEKVKTIRKQKLLDKVRDKKTRNLLNSESIMDDDSSSSSEEEISSDEETADQQTLVSLPVVQANDRSKNKIDEIVSHEALVADYIREALEEKRPLDFIVSSKMKPRHAMFPYSSNSHKRKFDDYGEVIDIKSFQVNDDLSNNKLIMESKKKFESGERRKWGNAEQGNDISQRNDNQNKLTPQEALNNEILQKNLDTLFRPVKRVSLGAQSSFSSGKQEISLRCGLSFVDLSGSVDLRSLSLIASSLKPQNIILLPDFSVGLDCAEELNGAKIVKSMFEKQHLDKDKQGLDDSSKFTSLAAMRTQNFTGFNNYRSSNQKLSVHTLQYNSLLQLGGSDYDENGIGLSNFEIKLDDTIIQNLKWQNVGDSYRVAQVFGELEFTSPLTKKSKLSDYINSSTQFTLKSLSENNYLNQKQQLIEKSRGAQSILSNSGAPKIAIGNIGLPELKKKLMSRNLNAEFKSEGTLVVNNTIAVRKIIYSNSEGEDSGDIAIDGSICPLYYEVKDCIREMLAYV